VTDPQPTRLWGGRFEEGPSDAMAALSLSTHFDWRLAPFDIQQTRAHAAVLNRAGLLTDAELADVVSALDSLAQDVAAGRVLPDPSDEDVHTAIERRVTELVGPAGGKLHTGRSRNDQVATAFRRYVVRELGDLGSRLLELAGVLLARADEAGTGDDGARLPGYTHLQHAQPVLLAHHLMAHAWALLRDVDRVVDCRRRADVSPLGAGALAGSSLPLDPDGTADELGFAARFENSLDATSDRDFAAETLFVCSLVAVHLSRLGEEVVLWSTDEFGFARLDDAYATGSSMLPQKKNPDIAELARGKAGRVIGDLTGFLATLKSLPLAYNRDLQEDKEPVFDALDTVRLGLGALAGLYRTTTFLTDRMASAADSPYAAATDLAEFLVSDGVPFRSAHAVVGALVRRSIDEGLPFAELVAAEPQLGERALPLLAPGAAVWRRTTPGGAGPVPVTVQRDRLAAALVDARARVDRPGPATER